MLQLRHFFLQRSNFQSSCQLLLQKQRQWTELSCRPIVRSDLCFCNVWLKHPGLHFVILSNHHHHHSLLVPLLSFLFSLRITKNPVIREAYQLCMCLDELKSSLSSYLFIIIQKVILRYFVFFPTFLNARIQNSYLHLISIEKSKICKHSKWQISSFLKCRHITNNFSISM